MTQIATFGGGCFWCTEAIYQQVNGVTKVVSGYMGGTLPNPTYPQICTGNTGHAEVIQVTFDPNVVSYEALLQVFFSTHNPTTLNRQGHDIGTQYRSVVFYHDDEQRAEAERVISQLSDDGTFSDPIVTSVDEAETFYPAEEKHQNYFADNQTQPYCANVIAPKVAKFLASQ